jgi:hypothetical protein
MRKIGCSKRPSGKWTLRPEGAVVNSPGLEPWGCGEGQETVFQAPRWPQQRLVRRNFGAMKCFCSALVDPRAEALGYSPTPRSGLKKAFRTVSPTYLPPAGLKKAFRTISQAYLLTLVLTLPSTIRASDTPQPSAALAAIQETQLTVRLASKQFQATVVAKDANTLTIVTAAHCVSANEVGSALSLTHADRLLSGRLVRAAQNPDYRPVASRDPQSKAVRGVLSVDNAVATIEVRPANDREKETFRLLKPAELTASPVPDRANQTLTVHILDQRGEAHVVKAGNHLNPKCLAWGNASYHPVPGDSGAGVFLVQSQADGKPTTLLIGNVALSDNRGGIAPLVSRKGPWVDEALNAAGRLTQPASNRPMPR